MRRTTHRPCSLRAARSVRSAKRRAAFVSSSPSRANSSCRRGAATTGPVGNRYVARRSGFSDLALGDAIDSTEAEAIGCAVGSGGGAAEGRLPRTRASEGRAGRAPAGEANEGAAAAKAGADEEGDAVGVERVLLTGEGEVEVEEGDDDTDEPEGGRGICRADVSAPCVCIRLLCVSDVRHTFPGLLSALPNTSATGGGAIARPDFLLRSSSSCIGIGARVAFRSVRSARVFAIDRRMSTSAGSGACSRAEARSRVEVRPAAAEGSASTRCFSFSMTDMAWERRRSVPVAEKKDSVEGERRRPAARSMVG